MTAARNLFFSDVASLRVPCTLRAKFYIVASRYGSLSRTNEQRREMTEMSPYGSVSFSSSLTVLLKYIYTDVVYTCYRHLLCCSWVCVCSRHGSYCRLPCFNQIRSRGSDHVDNVGLAIGLRKSQKLFVHVCTRQSPPLGGLHNRPEDLRMANAKRR